MRPILPLLLLVAACGGKPDGDDTDDTTPGDDSGTTDDSGTPTGPVSLAPGDVADMDENDDGSVSIDVVEPGTYIVVLMSQAIQGDTSYGYGSNTGQGARATLAAEPVRIEAPDVARKQPQDAVAVGDTRTFEVSNGSEWVTIEATAEQVTDEVVFWVDQTTTNEIGTLDEETIAGVLDSFETIVLPRERQVFGEESDVDGDGKVAILLSYTVNQSGPVAYVTWCDIGASSGCYGHSNGSEIIYLGIPDPEDPYGSVNGITETVAHELNHLIYAWHKYVALDQADASENIYLTEGMSALAQDLTGYNNGNQYVWAAALDMRDFYGSEDASIQGVSLNDFLRGSGNYDAVRDGTLRGAAYLFLRYLFEQAGDMTVNADGSLTDTGGMAFLHDWFDSPELGPDTVVATTGREVLDVAMDWYTAIVATGRVDTDPKFQYHDRVEDPLTGYEFGIDPFDTIHGWLELTGPVVQPLDEADGVIRAGGVEYLQVEITEPTTLTIPADSDARAAARLLRVE